MKKFTSLFALLSCLCVVSAQADPVTIYINASDAPNQRYWYWGSTSDMEKFSDRPYISSLPLVNGYRTLVLTPNGTNGVGIKFTGVEDNPQSEDCSEMIGSVFYFYYWGGNSSLNMSIVGSFNNWKKNSLIPTDYNHWTYVWDLTGNTNNIEFKIRPNNGWLGPNNITFTPGWVVNNGGNDPNFLLNVNDIHSAGYNKIILTVYKDSDSDTKWKLKIEGISQDTDTYTVGDNITVIGDNNILNLTDGSSFSATKSFTAASATYSRNFVDNWGTLCLPFEIKKSYEGVTFYTLQSVDLEKKILTFTPLSSTVAAGQPVVYKAADGVDLDINESGVTVSPTPSIGAAVDGWTLNGTFTAKNNYSPESGYWYFFSENKFWKGNQNNIPPYRAFFTTTDDLGSASQAPFRIETDDTEGLQFVEQEDGTVKAYYDLQGRKLDSARKGLVIENGKIIMVK